jgi:hypothetical protein
MAQHLKRWESPRRSGRNDKGRGGSARQRQIRKRSHRLHNQLREGTSTAQPAQPNQPYLEESQGSLFFGSLWFPGCSRLDIGQTKNI